MLTVMTTITLGGRRVVVLGFTGIRICEPAIESERLALSIAQTITYSESGMRATFRRLLRLRQPAYDRGITVEHAMPQTLSESWEAYLEEHEDSENYDSYLHMLGKCPRSGTRWVPAPLRSGT